MNTLTFLQELLKWCENNAAIVRPDDDGGSYTEYDEARADSNADLANLVEHRLRDGGPDQRGLLDTLVEGYADLTPDMTEESLARALTADHEWTDEGARSLVALVHDYGYFVLRNAAAMAS